MKTQVESVLHELGQKGFAEKEADGVIASTKPERGDQDTSSDIWRELRTEFS